MNPKDLDAEYEKESSSALTLGIAMLCALGGVLWLAASLFFLLVSEQTQGVVIENPVSEESSLLYRFQDSSGVYQQGRCSSRGAEGSRQPGDSIALRYMKGSSQWNHEDSIAAIIGGPATIMLVGFFIVTWLKFTKDSSP